MAPQIEAENTPVLDDAFYNVRCSSSQNESGQWRAQASIRRVDSGEEVDRLWYWDLDPKQEWNKLQHALKLKVPLLPRPPHEWGMVAVRQLLADYLELNYQQTKILLQLSRALAAQTLTEEQLAHAYQEALEKTMQSALAITWKLATLSETEQVQLMTSAEEVYQNQSDAANLDDFDCRNQLYRLIFTPSAQVTAAHERHLKRWDDIALRTTDLD